MAKANSVRDTLWTRTISVAGGSVYDCIGTRDGGFVFTGVGCAGLCPKAVKINSAGTLLWDSSGSALCSFVPGQIYSVDTTNDGGTILAGDGNANGASQGFIVKINADGSTEDDIAITDASHLRSIKGLSNGNYLIAGGTLSLGNGGGEDIYIARVNTVGTVLSASTYGSTGDQSARSLQLTTDGGAIVVGTGNWIIKTDENGGTD